jgi:uncharacterized membrane protein YtjA (UPF0391 family)
MVQDDTAVPVVVSTPVPVAMAPAVAERNGGWNVVRGTIDLDRSHNALRIKDREGNLTDLIYSDQVRIYRRGQAVSYLDVNQGDWVTVRYKMPSWGERRIRMLRWALIFFVISIVAGLLGFTGVAAGSAAIAKTLFFIAVALFLIFLVAALTVGEALTKKWPFTTKGDTMLETIAVVLLILWALGLVSSYTLGGFIHILLVVAIIMILIRVIRGRQPV